MVFTATIGGSTVTKYDVSGAHPVPVRSATTGADLADLTVSPDGHCRLRFAGLLLPAITARVRRENASAQ